ncbi:hypothetical protein [Acinetobacter beijerinckii]|uniref:hypothetical protein n=1 Tax=Acinetobacter beijerinckii TaxID=262668 RepID=UPI003AF45384
MRDLEKLKIINSFFGFISASSICGFIFYILANSERYARYEDLVVGFGLIFFICAILTIVIVLKYSSILVDTTYDNYNEAVYKGLKSGNFLGLIALSIVNVILFNPFFPIPSFFEIDTYDGIFNKAYSVMASSLVLSSFLYYTTRQQIKEIIY